MKTKLFTVLAFSLILSACSLLPQAKKPSSPDSNSATPTSTADKNIFNSIKDAVTKQIALKCEYNDDGNITTTYIKGQTVRLIGTADQVGVEGLMKDGKFYLWNSKDTQNKKGMIIDISKLEGAKMGETPVKSVDDVVAELEKRKENCAPSTESNSIFELPTDIEFSDASGFFNPTK